MARFLKVYLMAQLVQVAFLIAILAVQLWPTSTPQYSGDGIQLPFTIRPAGPMHELTFETVIGPSGRPEDVLISDVVIADPSSYRPHLLDDLPTR